VHAHTHILYTHRTYICTHTDTTQTRTHTHSQPNTPREGEADEEVKQRALDRLGGQTEGGVSQGEEGGGV
jgi:hypothetical protein